MDQKANRNVAKASAQTRSKLLAFQSSKFDKQVCQWMSAAKAATKQTLKSSRHTSKKHKSVLHSFLSVPQKLLFFFLFEVENYFAQLFVLIN